jgi:hypothetical protein
LTAIWHISPPAILNCLPYSPAKAKQIRIVAGRPELL